MRAVGQGTRLDPSGRAEDDLRLAASIHFTSDHGDYFGEHHLLGKANAFSDCLTRVPRLVSWPGHLPHGVRRPEPVSTIDVMPRLRSLAGVPLPDGVQGQRLPAAPGAPAPRRAVFGEYGAGGPAVTVEVLQSPPKM